MKKIILAGLLLFALTGCEGRNAIESTDAITASESEEGTTEPSSTGYPTGQLQREYVYVEGTLYQSAFEIAELPQNAERIGEVSKIDNEKYPDENFEASYLEIGTPIYKSGDMVYIEDSAGTHRRYEPVEGKVE